MAQAIIAEWPRLKKWRERICSRKDAKPQRRGGQAALREAPGGASLPRLPPPACHPERPSLSFELTYVILSEAKSCRPPRLALLGMTIRGMLTRRSGRPRPPAGQHFRPACRRPAEGPAALTSVGGLTFAPLCGPGAAPAGHANCRFPHPGCVGTPKASFLTGSGPPWEPRFLGGTLSSMADRSRRSAFSGAACSRPR